MNSGEAYDSRVGAWADRLAWRIGCSRRDMSHPHSRRELAEYLLGEVGDEIIKMRELVKEMNGESND